jgi:hypothetical protein
MLEETGLVLNFCQPGHQLTCSNLSSYVAVVAKKEYKPLDSSHKIRKARIYCFSHLHPDLFPHENGYANYFNDYDTNPPGCYSVSTGK